jgi:hypothetical protein
MSAQLSSFFQSALKSGLIVGCLDAVAASLHAYIMRGMTPDKVFTFVASGALGQNVYAGGSIMALVGLIFHFIIAIGWTFIFYAVYPKLTILQSNKFFAGMAYGIFIWLIMNFVVIPLSLIGLRPFNATSASIQIIIHLFIIGVPISYLTHKFYFNQ